MQGFVKTRYAVLGAVLLAASGSTTAVELSGYVSVQGRSFVNDPLDPLQHNNTASIATEPEWYFSSDDERHSFTFKPFYRHDQHDDERSHGDIRELSWQGVFDAWELTVGISKVYWGVTESQHLVDIINQTDLVENVDGEDKLGQAMLRFGTEQDWGLLDVFILPGFRERTFPGIEGRPHAEVLIDGDAASYASSAGKHHIDLAFRWLKLFGDWEIGLSHFSGTGREPESFQLLPSGVLAPHYTLINQTGLDLQALIDDWIWKLELIYRNTPETDFTALTGGFEYTLVGINDSNMDLGIVIEYLFDDRDEQSSSAFENDLATAFRLTLNDAASSEMLIGIITDLDDQIIVTFIEASRRIGDHFKLEAELRTFSNTLIGKPLHSFRDDDFVQIELAWYF